MHSRSQNKQTHTVVVFSNHKKHSTQKIYQNECLANLHRRCRRYPLSWPIESSIISDPIIFWFRPTLFAQDGTQSSTPINRIR